jgi:hypothetical protein
MHRMHHFRVSRSVQVHHMQNWKKKLKKMAKFQAKFKFELDENENRKVINNLPGLLCLRRHGSTVERK